MDNELDSLQDLFDQMKPQAEQVAAQTAVMATATVTALADAPKDFYDNYARIVARAVDSLTEYGFTREEAIGIAKGLNFK